MRRDIAKDLRVALVGILSPDGSCAGCNDIFFPVNLEIDHVDGRTWVPREMTRLQRSKRYWTEWLAGVRLRALCKSCNSSDGAIRMHRERSAA